MVIGLPKIRLIMGKIIFITGPTASGKSDLAIWLAKKINGEIINADSRQVYKYLDIGSGKIEDDKGIKHYLLSIASPKKNYSLGRWLKDVDISIKKILKKGKIPIICGGTILYLKALKEGWILPNVGPDYRLRKRLEKLDNETLYKKLLKLDKRRAKELGKENKRRLIRALEIAIKLGKIPKLKKRKKYEILILAPYIEFSKLEKKIYKRLLKRVDGIIKEIKKLRKIGLSFKRIISFGLEYEWFGKYLLEDGDLNYYIERCYLDIRRFARKQIRELNKIKEVNWIKDKNDAIKLVKNFLHL
ncbi:MAG: tRNA (adenosine(37)-N6)-dimethylallyltransferase MiaA [Minisyncoccia bacterium]